MPTCVECSASLAHNSVSAHQRRLHQPTIMFTCHDCSFTSLDFPDAIAHANLEGHNLPDSKSPLPHQKWCAAIDITDSPDALMSKPKVILAEKNNQSYSSGSLVAIEYSASMIPTETINLYSGQFKQNEIKVSPKMASISNAKTPPTISIYETDDMGPQTDILEDTWLNDMEQELLDSPSSQEDTPVLSDEPSRVSEQEMMTDDYTAYCADRDGLVDTNVPRGHDSDIAESPLNRKNSMAPIQDVDIIESSSKYEKELNVSFKSSLPRRRHDSATLEATLSKLAEIRCSRCSYQSTVSTKNRSLRIVRHVFACLGLFPYGCSLCDYHSVSKHHAARHIQHKHNDEGTVRLIDKESDEAKTRHGLSECFPDQNIAWAGL